MAAPSKNQAASLESQMIHPIQYVPGQTLRPSNTRSAKLKVSVNRIIDVPSSKDAADT